MSLKTYIINSSQASYRDNEYNILLRLLCGEGVFNINANNDDFDVIENPSGADMDVYCKTGAALVQYTKTGVTWKVVVEGAEQQSDTVSANSTGSNRIDAAVLVLAQTEPNAQKNNVATFQIVDGTGTSAMTDNEIDTAIGHSNWLRLADITVANGATTISNSEISDQRSAVSFGSAAGGYLSDFQGDGSNLSGIITNPFTATILPDTDVAYDIGSGGARVANMYAQYFHGDGSNLTSVPSAGVQETVTFGEDYPINDIPKIWTLSKDGSFEIYSGNYALQTFTTTADMSEISRVDLYVAKEGSGQAITVEIYALDGSSEPTGAALASATISARQIQGDYSGIGVVIPVIFSTAATVSPSTSYGIQVSSSGGSSTQNTHWWYDSAAPYTGGTGKTSTDSGSTWSTQTYDFAFVVYGDTDEPYPLYMENGLYTELLVNSDPNPDQTTGGKIYTTTQRGQNFVATNYDYITRVQFYLGTQGTVAGSTNITIALYAADSNGHPTGSALFSTTDTLTNFGITTSPDYIEVDVNTAITDGDEHVWVISMASAGDASNYLNWAYANASSSKWILGGLLTSSDGGSTWSNGSTSHTLKQWGYLQRTAGRVYRCDPAHPDRFKPMGWKETNDSVTSGNTDTLRVGGKIETLTGLTTGREYMLTKDMDIATNGLTRDSLPSFHYGSAPYYSLLMTSKQEAGPRFIPWLGSAAVLAGLASDTDTIIMPDPLAAELVPFFTTSDYNQDVTQDTVMEVPKRAKMAIVDVHYTVATDDSYVRVVLFKDYDQTVYAFQRDAGEYGVSLVWDPDAYTLTISDAGTSITRSFTNVTWFG